MSDYRVIIEKLLNGKKMFTVAEVFYDNNNNPIFYAEIESIYGEALSDIRKKIVAYEQALHKPHLESTLFKYQRR